MKSVFFLLIGILAQAQPMMRTKPVSKGEILEFRLAYGWFTIGKGTFTIADQYIQQSDRKCLKLDVVGQTAGLAGVFSRVDDKFGGLVDAENFYPYYSYRYLSEGNYDLREEVFFNYDSMQITVDQSSRKDKEQRPLYTYDMEEGKVFDLMGGLMHARSIDYGKLKKGDTIRVDAFFDKTFYDFAIVYQGIELLESKVGEINCFKVIPVMEKNSVFVGENAITFWLSADANRLPLRVEADMKFGTAFCELTSYKNVTSGIDFQ